MIKQIELCFLFSMDDGIEELVTTDLLSHRTLVDPSTGIPNIRSLYRRDSIISVVIHRVTNSNPKLEDLTVFCLLLYHRIGEF
jgi:hypothetical protein